MTTRHSFIFTFNFWSGHLYNKTDKEYCNNYDVEFTYNSVLKGFSSMIVKLLYCFLCMYLCQNHFRQGKVVYTLSFISQLLQYSLDNWQDGKFTIDYICMAKIVTKRLTTIMTTRHPLIFTFNFWSGHLYDNKTNNDYYNNYDVEFTHRLLK